MVKRKVAALEKLDADLYVLPLLPFANFLLAVC
jgi:hypothetical protein